MSSVVQGFEYDIFISYRQNDNRSGWVTDFVKALTEELAAAIKEPVTVYFDTNPHDGLLETHNVDKSLAGKLKCLIFIPVLSQTYCDRKSFAWLNEFCAFKALAGNDSFGIDIKLPNGNVASRILPIKIHDLDAEDQLILENQLGGVIRAIEFIYREAGVNRPLKPTDSRYDNQNKTDYRNQVNKTANAIKDIIRGLGLKHGTRTKYSHVQSKHASVVKQSILIEKSIAVLPFTDMSPAHDQEYLGDGLAEELINMLSQIKELKVTGRTSSFSFKNKNLDLTTIGRELNVENILEGSIQKADNRVRIMAQLINARDGFHVWSQRYDYEMDDIFKLQDEICLKISQNLKITLLNNLVTTPAKRQTKNLHAYELFLKGDFYSRKYSEVGFEKASEYLRKALELDPEYSDAWWYLGFVNYEMHGFLFLEKERLETAIHCAQKAIEVDETNPYGHFLTGLINLTYHYNWDKVKSEISLGNRYTAGHIPSAYFLPLEAWYRAMLFGDFDFAISRLLKGVEYDPLNFHYQFHLAQIYLYGARDYKKTISIIQNILELGFPPKPSWRPMSLLYLFEGNYELAEEYARKDYHASEGKGHGAAHLIMCLAASGKMEAANELYTLVRETLNLPQFPWFLHAKANIYLGNTDAAFEFLNKAIDEKNYWLFTLKYSPEWDLLRPDPRFEIILERMNFPQ